MKKLKTIFKKYSLIFALVVVVGIIIGGQYLNKKIKKEIKDMEEEIKQKYSKIKEYEREKENAPSPELITRLKKEKEFLKKQFKIMLTGFSTSYPTIPEFKMFPAVEFKEYLYFSLDKLQKKSRKRRVNFPTSLGFPTTGLAAPNQIPALSLQFEVVKDLINLIIDSGVSVINSITPGVPKKVDFYESLPLQLTITGTSNEIVRCLKYFENPSSYFIIENFSINRIKDNFYQADIGLSAVIIKEKEEKKAG